MDATQSTREQLVHDLDAAKQERLGATGSARGALTRRITKLEGELAAPTATKSDASPRSRAPPRTTR
jgi:hypothetical protein